MPFEKLGVKWKRNKKIRRLLTIKCVCNLRLHPALSSIYCSHSTENYHKFPIRFSFFGNCESLQSLVACQIVQGGSKILCDKFHQNLFTWLHVTRFIFRQVATRERDALFISIISPKRSFSLLFRWKWWSMRWIFMWVNNSRYVPSHFRLLFSHLRFNLHNVSVHYSLAPSLCISFAASLINFWILNGKIN